MRRDKELLGAHCSPILQPDGQPALRRPPDWNGLILDRMPIPAHAECGPQATGMPVVIAASQHPPGRRWYRCNGTTREIPMTAPGIDLLGATYERDYGRWECEPGGETIRLQLHPSVIERYIREDAFRFDLETRYAVKDDFLMKTLFTLADEMQQGLPNGVLYAEGLSLMIIGWLRQHHATKPDPASPRIRVLSARQKATVREFVDTYLDGDLSLERMASEIGISPYHFARLFRASFGMPPHHYVLQMRIARAAHFLRAEPLRPISDIALGTGFSSQAHLTNAFKSRMGQTPARWRTG